MNIDLSEFDITYVRSSGPGGQNVNKVNSKCVLKWIPAKSKSISDSVLRRFIERFSSRISSEGHVVVSSDRYRDQKRNYEDCIGKLQAMVSEVEVPPKIRKKTKATRSSQRKRVDEKRVHSDKKKMRRGSNGWE